MMRAGQAAWRRLLPDPLASWTFEKNGSLVLFLDGLPPLQLTGNPFSGTQILEVSTGRDLGGTKGVETHAAGEVHSFFFLLLFFCGSSSVLFQKLVFFLGGGRGQKVLSNPINYPMLQVFFHENYSPKKKIAKFQARFWAKDLRCSENER